ncbi:MAG: tetratricopeptide repeat protein [Niastella sp.]|nr:tetratricopeptide repeat protein [Niastella sp.]
MKKLFFIFLILLQTGYAQQTHSDSLEKKLQATSLPVQKLEILNQLVADAFNFDISKALMYAKQGVVLADKTGNKKWQPKFYEMAGRMHANLLHLDTASLFFDKAMAGYQEIGDKEGQASTAFKMAWIFKKKGKMDQAMSKDLYALKLMEETGNNAMICNALTRISEDLTMQERLGEAKDYGLKAIEMAEKNKLSSQLFYVYFNAGNVAMSASDYNASLDYYNKAMKFAKEQGESLGSICDITNSHGNALKRLGRYKEAKQDYETALKLAKQANYQNAIIATIANLGEINLLMGDYQDALGYQLETVKLQEQHNDLSNLTENYQHVSTIYENLGNYKSALEYQKKAYRMRDSVASVKSDTTMSKMLTRYETNKKEATIESQQSEISQQKKLQGLTVGILFLMLGFIVFGIISYRLRVKRNRLLAAKNAENELLLKEIHHRVKNNLEVVSSLLALQSAQIDDPNTKEAMREGQNRVHSIGIVHQKLYQGTNLGAIEMKDYFLNLGDSILDSFGAEKKIKIELAMEKLEIDIDTAVPLGLIVNELLTNTIKYAFPTGKQGNVVIKLEKGKTGVLHLEVSDDGVGKSSNIQGTGFGSQLVSLLTRQLRGNMKEEIHNGTHTYFNFNLDKVA